MTKTYELPNEKMIMADVDEKRHMATVSIYALDDLVRAVNKSGHWEWLTEDKYRCSNCNSETRVDECLSEPMYEFCPFCRARMTESEEYGMMEEIDFIQPKKTVGKLISADVLDKIRAEIEQTTSRYTISRERGAMGQVEWSDRLIKESEILEILDKYKAESDDSNANQHNSNALNALEGDAISRQAVTEIINDIRDCISVEGYCAILERMKKLPPANPQESKTGHWINQDEGAFYPIECSECHKEPLLDSYGDYVFSNYCPVCGARMAESEGKE